MKRLFSGVFLAVLSLPTAFLIGLWVYEHTPGGFPRMLSNALEVASYVTGAILLLAVFVFMSGLSGGKAKVHAPSVEAVDGGQ